MSEYSSLLLAAIATIAAVVTGALGYGFSSITVPLALLFLTNRLLNPALVLVEVGLNASVVWTNRAAVPFVWRRVLPVLAGLTPGVAAGTLILSRVDPAWLKLATFVVLLPLILLQAAGVRRPIAAERSAGVVLGGGVGLLYSVTTISGPPLAVMLSNQGLAGAEFRAALGLIRVAESTMTGAAYAWAGLFTIESQALVIPLIVGAAVGLPVGARLIRHVAPEAFRRICMSFDAWVVGFGLSRVLMDLRIAGAGPAFSVLAGVAAIDTALLIRFFRPGARLRGASDS